MDRFLIRKIPTPKEGESTGSRLNIPCCCSKVINVVTERSAESGTCKVENEIESNKLISTEPENATEKIAKHKGKKLYSYYIIQFKTHTNKLYRVLLLQLNNLSKAENLQKH